MKKSERRKPTTISHADAQRLARQIADRLFVAGNGERATRLILADARDTDRAGWCKAVIVDQAMQAITELFEVQQS